MHILTKKNPSFHAKPKSIVILLMVGTVIFFTSCFYQLPPLNKTGISNEKIVWEYILSGNNSYQNGKTKLVSNNKAAYMISQIYNSDNLSCRLMYVELDKNQRHEPIQIATITDSQFNVESQVDSAGNLWIAYQIDGNYNMNIWTNKTGVAQDIINFSSLNINDFTVSSSMISNDSFVFLGNAHRLDGKDGVATCAYALSGSSSICKTYIDKSFYGQVFESAINPSGDIDILCPNGGSDVFFTTLYSDESALGPANTPFDINDNYLGFFYDLGGNPFYFAYREDFIWRVTKNLGTGDFEQDATSISNCIDGGLLGILSDFNNNRYIVGFSTPGGTTADVFINEFNSDFTLPIMATTVQIKTIEPQDSMPFLNPVFTDLNNSNRALVVPVMTDAMKKKLALNYFPLSGL